MTFMISQLTNYTIMSMIIFFFQFTQKKHTHIKIYNMIYEDTTLHIT